MIIQVPNHTHVVVMAYRAPPCSLLLNWLRDTGYDDWELGSQEYGIDIARNQTVNRFLAERPGVENVLLIDADMVPTATKRGIESPKGECLWWGYVGHQGSQGHVSSFGAGMCRLSRTLLERMPRPWFKTTYNDELTLRLECECKWFADRARECGAEPKLVGFCGHQQGGDAGPVLLPKIGGGFTAKWPAEIVSEASAKSLLSAK